MKKLFALLALVLALTVVLCACSTQTTTPTEQTPAEETTAEEAPAEETTAEEAPAEGDNIGEAVTAEQENAAEETADPYEGQYTVEEVMIDDDGTNIYARIYKPVEEQESYAACIMSHGIGGTYLNCEPYAKQFAAGGVVAVAIDFQGGGPGSQSDGEMVDMSTLTEAQDLEVVTEYVKNLDYVNKDQLFLLGESMGGFVSAYTAGIHPDDYNAIVLFYPAFVLQDDAWQKYPDGPETALEVEEMYGLQIGKKSYIDNMSFDIYEIIPDFKGDVLIVHGDSDQVVPLSYSDKAVEVYGADHCKLVVLPGAEHGFRGDDVETAGTEALNFVLDHTR